MTALRDVIDARPELPADMPLVAPVGHLTQAVTSLLELVEFVTENDAFLEEFRGLPEDEQNLFGARVAAGLLTVRAACSEAAAAVADAFTA